MRNKLDILKNESLIKTLSKIKNNEIKIVDLVTEHLKRAHDINPEINAFITILDEAIEKAKVMDMKIESGEIDLNNNKNKLLGIPFSVKDLYLVEGTRTTFGSKIAEDFIAPYTATVVQKCLDEGAILIGKCNCDPWGFGGSGENSGYGATKHPLDFSRTPGGSSSGSAASLLAGVGFFSLGTDTGGSIRLPASFCGLVGLKPTYGKNSRYGVEAMGSSFDTPGFFTRNVEDARLLEEIMQGRDIKDSTTYNLKFIESKDVKQLKIGLPIEYFNDGLNEQVKKAIDNQISKLKIQGYKIQEVSMPSIKFGLAVYYILVPSEISSNRARYDGVRYGKKMDNNYENNMIETRSTFFEEEVKRRIMIGTYSLSEGYGDQYYKQASNVRTKLKQEFNEVFEEVDLLLAPVSPNTAFKLGEKSSDPVQMYLVDIFTVTANLVGIPSLSIPIDYDENNLPIGLQIMGRKFEENNLFNFANIILNKN